MFIVVALFTVVRHCCTRHSIKHSSPQGPEECHHQSQSPLCLCSLSGFSVHRCLTFCLSLYLSLLSLLFFHTFCLAFSSNQYSDFTSFLFCLIMPSPVAFFSQMLSGCLIAFVCCHYSYNAIFLMLTRLKHICRCAKQHPFDLQHAFI